MAELYKLTEGDWTTMNCTKWGPGVTHIAIAGIPLDLISLAKEVVYGRA